MTTLVLASQFDLGNMFENALLIVSCLVVGYGIGSVLPLPALIKAIKNLRSGT